MKSGEQLAPLGDPLALNVGEHRWLSEDREESYSDWLAWILQGMKNGEEVLPLFGLDDATVSGRLGAVQKVVREMTIADGRADILVRFEHGLLLIEVKIQVPGRGLFKTLRKYADWVRNQPVDQKLMILLAHETLPEDMGEDDLIERIKPFEFADWRTFCMRLRRHANRIKRQDLMRSAALLIFSGAVEQNLLGLSEHPPRFHGMATVDYLNSWQTA